MPVGARALLVTALGQAFLPAFGEVFKLQSRTIPGAHSLQGIWAFTIYSPEDSPKKGGKPFVEYRNLVAHSRDSSSTDASLDKYESLQIALISETDYKEHIEKDPVCDWNQLNPKNATVELHVVNFAKSQWQHVELNGTGTYFLLVSNCGNMSLGEISGEVAVKNPFGYLSGTDYHKMSFYVWIFCAYGLLAGLWTILCIMWKSELIVMHGIISWVLCMSLLESGAWLGYLSSVNQVGETADSTVSVLVMLTVLRTYTLYTFILVISQGWRMTEEVLDDCKLIKLSIFGLVWTAVSFLHESAMTYRHSLHISSELMVMTTIPALIANLIVFAWVFLSLGSLSKTLKERKLDDQLQAITRFTEGLIISVFLGCFTGVVQLLNSAGSLKFSWKFQYLSDGGMAHVIFIFMVALSMYVWKPSPGSAQLGYAQPCDQNEEDGLCKEDGGDENGHGSRVAPATVGAQYEDL